MRISRILCSIAVLALVISACKGSSTDSDSDNDYEDGIYTIKILPSELTIKLPSSLEAAATGSPSIVGAESIKKDIANPGTEVQVLSSGYWTLKTVITIIDAMKPTFIINAIIIDAVISQNNLSAGYYEKIEITLTQGMYDAVAAQLPADKAPDPALVGSTYTLYDIVYSTSGIGTFQNSLSYNEGYGNTFAPKYEWSSDRTRLKMSNTFEKATMTISYDSATNSCAYNSDFGDYYYKLACRRDTPNATKKGTFFRMEEVVIVGGPLESMASGYADDDGGLANSSVNAGSGDEAWSYFYKDGFSGNGSLLYAIKGPNFPPDTVEQPYNDISPVTSYGTRANEAGDASTYGALALL
jgi:hypothetical protein